MFARLAATQGGGLSVGHREYNCAHAEEGGRGNGPTRREAVVTVPCPALCRGRRCQRSWARWDASVQHLRQCQRVRMDQPGRLFLCARCRQQVVLCSRCDRGNRYCGRACWRLSREAAAREAGSRYQRSYRGRLAHAQRARRWRQRRAQAPQNVTHQGCPAEAANAPLLAWPHDTTTAIVELVEPDCAGHDETPPASFVLPFAPKLALIPDLGATWNLPRLLGGARAQAVTMLGDRISAAEAVQWGMIWRCVPDLDLRAAAADIAERLAAAPPGVCREVRQAYAAAQVRDLA